MQHPLNLPPQVIYKELCWSILIKQLHFALFQFSSCSMPEQELMYNVYIEHLVMHYVALPIILQLSNVDCGLSLEEEKG